MNDGAAAARSSAPTAQPLPDSTRSALRVGGPVAMTPPGSTTRLQAGKGSSSCLDSTPSGRLHSGIQNQRTACSRSAGGSMRWNSGSLPG